MNSLGESSRACMSYLDALLSALARAFAPALVARCAAPSSAAVGLCMHDDGTPVHDVCSNSWSDTGSAQGPRGRKARFRVRPKICAPVPEVEAGVTFRPPGGVRVQVAGLLPGRQPGRGTRKVMEVPGTQFASPGRGYASGFR